MDDITNLKDFKNVRLIKRYLEDINRITHILTTTQKALSFFKQYIQVQEIVSVIETNKVFLDLNRKKYEKELEKLEKKHSKEDKA